MSNSISPHLLKQAHIWVRNANDRSSNNGDQSIPESEFKPISEEDRKMKKDSIPFGGAMKMKVAFWGDGTLIQMQLLIPP